MQFDNLIQVAVNPFSNRNWNLPASVFGNSKKNDAIIQSIGKVSVRQESEWKSGVSVKRDNEKSKQNEDASWQPVRARSSSVYFALNKGSRHKQRKQSSAKVALGFTSRDDGNFQLKCCTSLIIPLTWVDWGRKHEYSAWNVRYYTWNIEVCFKKNTLETLFAKYVLSYLTTKKLNSTLKLRAPSKSTSNFN